MTPNLNDFCRGTERNLTKYVNQETDQSKPNTSRYVDYTQEELDELDEKEDLEQSAEFMKQQNKKRSKSTKKPPAKVPQKPAAKKAAKPAATESTGTKRKRAAEVIAQTNAPAAKKPRASKRKQNDEGSTPVTPKATKRTRTVKTEPATDAATASLPLNPSNGNEKQPSVAEPDISTPEVTLVADATSPHSTSDATIPNEIVDKLLDVEGQADGPMVDMELAKLDTRSSIDANATPSQDNADSTGKAKATGQVQLNDRIRDADTSSELSSALSSPKLAALDAKSQSKVRIGIGAAAVQRNPDDAASLTSSEDTIVVKPRQTVKLTEGGSDSTQLTPHMNDGIMSQPEAQLIAASSSTADLPGTIVDGIGQVENQQTSSSSSDDRQSESIRISASSPLLSEDIIYDSEELTVSLDVMNEPATPKAAGGEAAADTGLPTPPPSAESTQLDLFASDNAGLPPAVKPGNIGGLTLGEKDVPMHDVTDPATERQPGTTSEDAAAENEIITGQTTAVPTKRKSTSSKAKTAAKDKTTAGRVKKPGNTKSPSTTQNRAVDDRSDIPKQPSKLQLPKNKKFETTTRKVGRKTMKKLVVTTILPHAWNCMDIDDEKSDLSTQLMRRKAIADKPEPQGKPMVWAESRQALCETLSYFKKPQGGCYQNDGHVYAFLFDGVGHCREYMDSDVIICRAGGSMELDASGGMVQAKDQTFKEAQVQAVLNDIKHQNPLIVICGKRNTAAWCKMPHQYSVLGWYKPIMVWSEKTAGKGKKVWTTVKYRLERLNCDEPAWHTPKSDHGDYQTLKEVCAQHSGDLSMRACDSCNKESAQVYLRGWICLNAECEQFWKSEGRDVPYDARNLEYNPAFLLYRSKPWKADADSREPEPTDLRPPVPEVGNIIGDNLAYVNTRGVCCPECGRCNSRRLFKGWVCETCGWKFFPKHHPVLPTMLHTPWDAAPTLIRNAAQSGVHLKIEYKHGYKIATYTFDGIDGRFIHAAATKAVVQEAGTGPDAMFAALQTEDMGLERRTFGVKKVSGAKNEQAAPDAIVTDAAPLTFRTPPEEVDAESAAAGGIQAGGADQKAKYEFDDGDLMTAFSMNYGMPYKFVASGASKPFEEGPWPVAECRRRLNWAQREFLDNKGAYVDLNEQLIFAYLEGQKIEYHDDGEEGLGPRIATLSLGGRAKMHLRMKLKHFVGCSKQAILTEERPVPGGIGGSKMDDKRLKAWEELQDLRYEKSTEYQKRRKELPRELGLLDKRVKKADDLVTITLSHGDIVIMEGYDVQRYLEHKVVPEGCLRFAMTCRTVLENHLKAEELPNYTVDVDETVYEGPKLGGDWGFGSLPA